MRIPFHPLLFAAFPVLFLFRENLWGLETKDMVLPISATVGAVLVLQVVFSLLTRKGRKVAIVLSVSTILFLTYGHIWRVLADRNDEYLGYNADVVLGSFAVAILLTTTVLVVRTKSKLRDATRLMNAFAVAMFATVAIPLAMAIVDGTPASTAQAGTANVATDTERKLPNRDIYYLVFDRYAGASSLKELFGYDNRRFLGRLESKGFEIADDARANYQATAPSLASSLNMRYLDWLTEATKRDPTTSALPTFRAVNNHRVGKYLQSQGYRYVHIGSRWDITRDSPIADVNVRLDETSEFTRVFLGSTALLPAMRNDVLLPPDSDNESMARAVALRQFDEVKAARRFRGPKFVFAHFGVPHPPYVFDKHGRFAPGREHGVQEKARAYFQQLQYTNTRITEVVDHLLDVPKGREPIIILQADEGPYPGFGGQGSAQWWKAPDRKLRTKYAILMATYMPGLEDTGATEHLSPVNVFRLVFNNYFGTDLRMLGDRSYCPTHKGFSYDFTEVTDRLDPPRDSKLGPPLYPPYVPVLPQVRRSA